MNCRNNSPLFFLLVLLLTPIAVYSQSGNLSPFVLKGEVTLNDKSAEGVTLELTKGGTKITKIITPKNGKYSMDLKQSITDKESEYVLTISKPGTVTKNLSINTYLPKKDYTEEPFIYELDISLIATNLKDVVLQRPSAKIKWNTGEKTYGFDQAYAKIIQKEDAQMTLNPDKYFKELKKKADELNKKKAKAAADSTAAFEADKAEKARKEAEIARAKAIADSTDKANERIEAEKILKQKLEAATQELLKKRKADSLAAIEKNEVVPVVPVKVTTVESAIPEFDGTHAFSLNVEKNKMKIAKEKTEKKKAANLSTKYETSNSLTSLLDVVDSFEKKLKK